MRILQVKLYERERVGKSVINKVYIREGGRRCLQGNLWYSPPASVTSRLASVTFKMASKVFIEETDKNLDFVTEILFRFLGFGDFKVPIVINKKLDLCTFFGMKCPVV